MEYICRGCKARLLSDNLIEFHNMPKSAQFFPSKEEIQSEQGMDICLKECVYCGLVQAVGEPVPYYRDVIRATSVSEEMKNFRITQYKEWVAKHNLFGEKIIEIGSGTGEYMEMMKQAGVKVFGLEHFKESVETGRKKGFEIFEGFIEDEKYNIPNAPYKGFYIMNFLEHIPNPVDFLRGIVNNLCEEAYGIVEVPNFDMMLKKSLYSEFIQDHLSYFTEKTLKNMLENNGFDVISCKSIWYDYILSAEVKRKKRTSVVGMIDNKQSLKEQVKAYLKNKKNNGKKIATWGAGHQALANLSLLDMTEYIEVVIDSAKFKQDKYTPATHIPIVAPEFLNTKDIDTVIVMAGGYSSDICRILDDKYPWVEKVVLGEDGLYDKD